MDTQAGKNDLLQNIPVELLLPITQEFPDHLPAQALPLQQEVCHAHRCVGDESPFRQILDALLWLPGRTGEHKDELKGESTTQSRLDCHCFLLLHFIFQNERKEVDISLDLRVM